MKSLDEQEEELDKLTNQCVKERFEELEKALKETDEFNAFLDLWVNEVEKYFGKCKVKYKLKGKEKWVGER